MVRITSRQLISKPVVETVIRFAMPKKSIQKRIYSVLHINYIGIIG